MPNAIRAIAKHLTHLPTTEAAAAELLFRALHDGRCPRCNSRDCVARGRQLRCRSCTKTSSLTARTALARTKLPMTLWLHAIHAIHVATSPTSARGFARIHGVRPMTAWALLHRVREALPTPRPQGGPTAQLLGHSGGTAAWVRAQANPIALVALHRAPRRRGPHQPAAALLLGQLRAQLIEIYKGVSPQHLQAYVDEFADRYGRVGAQLS